MMSELTSFIGGDEFQINDHAGFNDEGEFPPSIAALVGGGYVVVWTSNDIATGDTDSLGIAGRIYDANGNPVGGELLLNTHTVGFQAFPKAVGLADGSFIVNWSTADPASGDADTFGVVRRRFDASGNPLEGEVLVNTTTAGEQFAGDVVVLSDGSYVVVWAGDPTGMNNEEIYGQRYNAAGSTLGGEFQINTNATSQQSSPAVVALDGGGFVVVWRSLDTATGDTSSYGIAGQRYDNGGVAQGGEFLVNTHTGSAQLDPGIASLSDGGFVVVWRSSDSAIGDASSGGIAGQRFNASGVAQGSEFIANTNTVGDQFAAAVTGLDDGGFVVTWGTSDPASGDADLGVAGRCYDADGDALGDEFLINLTKAEFQVSPGMATLADGSFVVAWSNGNNLNAVDIIGRRYQPATALEIKGLVTGDEFLANTDTAGFQSSPAVAPLVGGSFVTIWVSFDSPSFVAARVYSADGNSIGDEFQVNVHSVTSQDGPAVAGLQNGGFVAAWESEFSTEDSEFGAVSARLFNADGTPQTDEFQVNTFTANSQNEPSVATLNDGTFVVVWQSRDPAAGDTSVSGISGQHYTESGTRIGTEFLVNTGTSQHQVSPDVAALADGGFIVIWHNGSNGRIFGQRFDANANPVGVESRLDNYRGGDPEVAGLAGGGFVAVWFTASSETGDTSSNGVNGRIFDSNGTPLGDEFLLNSNISGAQLEVDVAGLADGGFIAVWGTRDPASGDPGSNDWGVSAQCFLADGTKVGTEFLINDLKANDQRQPAVAGFDDGGFVVLWESDDPAIGDTESNGIAGRQYRHPSSLFVAEEARVHRFSPSGELLVNSDSEGAQQNPDVAPLKDGGFLVVWDTEDAGGSNITAQRYSAAAELDGDEFQINTNINGLQSDPVVAGLNSGGFVVAWTTNDVAGGDTDTTGIAARLYDVNSLALAGEFRVNSKLTNGQDHPTVAALADGGFVVVWTSNDITTGDTDASGIAGQLYSASGIAQGNEFLVNSFISGTQLLPAVAALTDGGFVVVWVSNDVATGDTVDSGIAGQRYDVSGVRIGDEFLINTNIQGIQTAPSITALHDGGFLVAWQSADAASGDTEGIAIVGQHYGADGTPVGDEFLINVNLTGNQTGPRVVTLSDGGFVVAWWSEAPHIGAVDSAGIAARRFSPAGVALGEEFKINTYTVDTQLVDPESQLATAALADDGFVAVWTSTNAATGGAGPSNISVHRYQFTTTHINDLLARKTGSFDTGNATLNAVEALPDGSGEVNIVNGRLVFEAGTDFDHLGPGESIDIPVNYTWTNSVGRTKNSSVTIRVLGRP